MAMSANDAADQFHRECGEDCLVSVDRGRS